MCSPFCHAIEAVGPAMHITICLKFSFSQSRPGSHLGWSRLSLHFYGGGGGDSSCYIGTQEVGTYIQYIASDICKFSLDLGILASSKSDPGHSGGGGHRG
jgi:hypothetical protein